MVRGQVSHHRAVRGVFHLFSAVSERCRRRRVFPKPNRTMEYTRVVFKRFSSHFYKLNASYVYYRLIDAYLLNAPKKNEPNRNN